jgi:hypothetical protein
MDARHASRVLCVTPARAFPLRPGTDGGMDPSLTLPPSRSERASAAMRRVLWMAASVLRGLTILALVAAGAVAVAGLAWLVDTPPGDGSEWGARVVILAALLAPPILLLLFVAGLRDLGRLPERTKALPADVSARARDLRGHARRIPQPRGILGAIVALFRLGREVLGARDALSPFGAFAIVLRPAMLLAALFAALAAVLEIPAAILFLLILTVT